MKKFNIILISLLFITGFLYSSPRVGYLTIGPMFHYYFGKNSGGWNFSFELAYWNHPAQEWGDIYTAEDGVPGYSCNIGIEGGGKGKKRIYSEFQTGIQFVGVSIGPVMEIDFKGKNVQFGIQGSAWANYLLGLDIRIRYISEETFFSPGIYAKVPIKVHTPDEDGNIIWFPIL
jgi:hypothetical protein